MTMRLRLMSFVAACLVVSVSMPAFAARDQTLEAFKNDAELIAYLRAIKVRREADSAHANNGILTSPAPPSAPTPLLAPSSTQQDASGALASVAVMGSAASPESITNNQTAGIDEGDIVKQSRGFLVVLRRGRLFTVRIASEQLQPVSMINAYGPGVDPGGTWYDEMLVTDGQVVVIGFSYRRGGTEISRFTLDKAGGLHYRDTYQLRGNDYYSARNYASRLMGHRLIFYTPIDINLWDKLTPQRITPALRRWHPGVTPADFKRIVPADRIYRSPAAFDDNDQLALHAVTTCDLDTPQMTCQSTAVLGPRSRVFYVSMDAVYVWTTSRDMVRDKPNPSFIARIPLDGAPPRGLRTGGSPVDQMSFLQRDGWLNVLVSSQGAGEGMWASESAAGELALLRVPLSDFGDGTDTAKPSRYRPLPSSDIMNFDTHNRFVGDWLLYGTSDTWWKRSKPGDLENIYGIHYTTHDPAQSIALGHQVARIEALQGDAVVIGNAGDDLDFTTLRLTDRMQAVSRYIMPKAEQGDDRTHGFFYKPQSQTEGLLGLPIISSDVKGRGDSASVLFLRNQVLHLARAGSLGSDGKQDRNDGCKASCVDWYGDARPIFLGDRVFALLGYELVEGTLRDGRIHERRRVDFGPD